MTKYKRLNRIYNGMKSRCYRQTNSAYKYYGGRGITICEEWLCTEREENKPKGWIAFKTWALENGYRDDLTIDRIDVNGNYEPSNCRWVTNKEQCNNTRRNRYITYNNKTQTLSQWCYELGLKYHRVLLRLDSGMSVQKAFEEKSSMKYRMITYDGKTQSLKDWCKELNLNYSSVCNRLDRFNFTIEQAFKSKRVNARTKLVTYRNKTQSLADWCKELNLNYKTIHNRLNTQHWTVEKTFETPIN